MADVRVRFAPSPTGDLHLGGARTALFNYLFARHHGGRLLLRIEDTDRERSRREYEERILKDLRWLGLDFDEGPHRQSDRRELYAGAARRLKEGGLAYEAEDEAGRRALYFRPPQRSGRFRDELRGEVRFGKIRDFVILKSDGMPAYNFAAVVDDVHMEITHVIRGEEHLPNTGRQVFLYRALGAPEPRFLHLGLILGPDGRKLSKRHGARSVRELREEGYLPEAVLNYLALLGWTHPAGREEFAGLAELVAEWDPSRLGASPARFDPERLLHFNARHLRRLPARQLARLMQPFLETPLPPGREEVAVEAVREEMRLLSDAPRLLGRLLGPVDPGEVAGRLPEGSAGALAAACRLLEGRWPEGLEEAREFLSALRRWAKEHGMGAREVLHPLRVALTGEDRGPRLEYIIVLLGPEEARRRMERAREARLRA
ncbi:glutamate--tRNA ligase [Rubrobacter xylanophilus]|uniref:Glutamate--tRNA ligase n=1 Tax=Rubrobacter xylanophilus TaxID=49319 RepID=A0A510HHY3_9ACTN|nr:glutamate--tRNA ligase family protein [Rubrobacter xylanophilus]BBL79602.1 glutamate--tRNA ligase [Rubrobacter xylanophilus]